MAVDLSELLAERRPLAIPLLGGTVTLNIVYNPASQTEDIERQVRDAINEDEVGRAIRTYVKAVVREWDLTEDGKVIPFEDEALIHRVPAKVLFSIFEAIGKDLRSGEAEGSSGERSGIQTFQD